MNSSALTFFWSTLYISHLMILLILDSCDHDFFRSAWNLFDFIITVLTCFSFSWEAITATLNVNARKIGDDFFNLVNVLRPLRLLRC